MRLTVKAFLYALVLVYLVVGEITKYKINGHIQQAANLYDL